MNKPLKTYKAGSVTATIWENKLEKGSFLTISLDRSYKDKNNEWKKTSTLRLNDIPKAELVLRKAYEFSVTSESNSENQ